MRRMRLTAEWIAEQEILAYAAECCKEAQLWSVLWMPENRLFHAYGCGWPMFASIDKARHSALKSYVRCGVDLEDFG